MCVSLDCAWLSHARTPQYSFKPILMTCNCRLVTHVGNAIHGNQGRPKAAHSGRLHIC